MPKPTKIKEYRKKAGYTQRQIAEYLQVTERTYQNYEAGTRRISLSQLKALSQLFNEPIDALVGDLSDNECSQHSDAVDIEPNATADYSAKIRAMMDELGISEKYFDELNSFIGYLRYLDS